MIESYKVNDRVVATREITEGGPPYVGDVTASFPCSNYIHANEGEYGTIVFVHKDNAPTVRFDRTGTATIVDDEEINVI